MKTCINRIHSGVLATLLGATLVNGQFNTGFVGEQYLSNPSDGVNVGFTAGTPSATLSVNGWDLTS